MAEVKDRWYTGTGRNKVKTARYGVGKRWEVRWREGSRRLSKAFERYDQAEHYAASITVAMAEGTYIDRDKQQIPLSDMWEIWQLSKTGKSFNTQETYRHAWGHIAPRWATVKVVDITREDFTNWLATLVSKHGTPLGASAARKVGLTMRGLLEQAVEMNIIHHNPIKSSDLPRQKPSNRRYLTVGELDRLLAAAPTEEARLMVNLLMITGLRPGEAKGLQVQDLDATRGRLLVQRSVDIYGKPGPTKTGRSRAVPVGGTLLWDLEDNTLGKKPTDWLVPDEYGNVWTTTRWRRVWHKMCQEAGIEGVTTYELRHTAASMAIASGADAKMVQRMLGHANASMTLDIYGHLMEDGMDAIPARIEEFMEAERIREREARRRNRDEHAAREAHRRAKQARIAARQQTA